MNRGLLHPDRPVHPDPPRRRIELGVHPDDDVALLEAEPEQGLEAVRADSKVAAELGERPPQLDRAIDRVVELEGRLAREREAHDVTGDARDVRVNMTEEPRRVREARRAPAASWQAAR